MFLFFCSLLYNSLHRNLAPFAGLLFFLIESSQVPCILSICPESPSPEHRELLRVSLLGSEKFPPGTLIGSVLLCRRSGPLLPSVIPAQFVSLPEIKDPVFLRDQ